MSLLLALVTLAALLPFLAKPLHIDDPLFVWSAHQIRQHPLDPCGFDVNWYGTAMPMHAVTKNPPLACYWLAAASLLMGWSEIALHAAMLLPAVGAVVGTYLLARELAVPRPALAAALTLASPLFFVSATTLMCDVPMLCLWVWAVLFWVRGVREKRFALLLLAGGLVTLGELTKYFGASLIPLLAAYAIFKTRRPGMWIAALAVPILALLAYHVWSVHLYGHSLLLGLSEYGVGQRAAGRQTRLGQIVVTFSFLGGGAIGAGLMYLLAAPRPLLVIAAIAFFVAAIVLASVQYALFVVLGAVIVAACVCDVRKHRDAESALLALWLIGTILFTALLNWTVNGRTMLPAAPAAALLVARYQRRNKPEPHIAWLVGPVALSGVIALLCAYADTAQAFAARDAARQILQATRGDPGRLWFRGHWGFQWYMEQGGARPIDVVTLGPRPGDFIASANNNSNVAAASISPGAVQPLLIIHIVPCPVLATMSRQSRAGFYTSLWGPLPYAFDAHVPPDEYILVRLLVPMTRPKVSSTPRAP